MKSIYQPIRVMNAAPLAEWFDGVKAVSTVDQFGVPVILIKAGWTDAHGADQHVSQLYKTYDNGATVTRLTDPPQVGRHNNLFFVNPVDGKVYDCFGDGTDNTFPQDVNRYDFATDSWTNITNSAGIGSKQGYFCCIDDKYAIVGGGYGASITTYSPQIYRASLSALAAGNGAFTYIGDVPDTMHPSGDVRIVCFKGKLFHYGVGQRTAVLPFNISTKIHMSKDSGKTWTIVGDLPENFGILWSDFTVAGNCVIGVSGSYPHNGLYPCNIIYSEDGINFTFLAGRTANRHASVIVSHLQDVVSGMGYQQNNLSLIEKISTPYNEL